MVNLDAKLASKAAAPPPAEDRRPTPFADVHGPRACSYLTETDVSTLTGVPIGKPVPSESDDRTSCTYPSADASAAQIAKIIIDWEYGGAPSVKSELARTFRSHSARHAVELGDGASYGGTVLTIRVADARIAVKVPAGPDAETKATAIGKLLVERMKK